MNFTKIQPQQLQLPTFFSNSGDLVFSDLVTGFRVNLSRNLAGDFVFQDSITINGFIPLLIDDSLIFNTASGSMVIGGQNNIVSGELNIVVGGSGNNLYGDNNVILHAGDSNFPTGASNNTLIAGNTVTFNSGVTGSTFIGDSTAIATVDQSKKLIIDFASGHRFLNATTFEADVGVTGNLTISGNKVARFLDITGASGANTIIENDNIAVGNGVLRIRVGSKIFTVSGSYA
jgi:hypothetical protein